MLDEDMRGQALNAADFESDGIPPAPFAVLIAAAFDQGRAALWGGGTVSTGSSRRRSWRSESTMAR